RAERALGRVPGHVDGVGPLLAEHGHQHIGEAEESPGRPAVGRGEVAPGEEGAEEQAVPVYEYEPGPESRSVGGGGRSRGHGGGHPFDTIVYSRIRPPVARLLSVSGG